MHHACSLYDLPIELLYEVQIHSCWHTLPLTSKRLYHIFKASPLSVRAEYLVSRYLDSTKQPRDGQPSLVSRSLRYPICTPSVLDMMLDLPNCPPIPLKPRTELPRRLFRDLTWRASRRWRPSDPPLPMLDYLFSHPRIPPPDPNDWDGYALTKAAAAGFVPLVRFLLDQGASPVYKRGLAVHAAIRRKDLALVKLLIEPDPSSAVSASSTASTDGTSASVGLSKDTQPVTKPGGKKRVHDQSSEPSTKKSAKKRRLEDRIPVTQEMLKTAVACDARDIVQYFVQDKLCMPDMQTVRTMRFP